MNRVLIHHACVVGAYVAWGVLPLFWSLLSGVDAVTVLYQRTVWSAVFLLGMLWARGGLGDVVKLLTHPRDMKVVAVSAVLLAMNWFLYVYGLKEREYLAVSLAYYLCPLMTVTGAALLFGEKLSRPRRCALLVIVVGVSLPVVMAGEFPLLALAIGGSWSGYTLVKRRFRLPTISATCLETVVLSLALTVILPLVIDHPVLLPALTTPRMLSLFALSGVVTAVPILALVEGMKSVPMRTVGMLQYLAPSLTLMCSVLYFDAVPTGVQLSGLAVIWLGLVVFFSDRGVLSRLPRLLCRYNVGINLCAAPPPPDNSVKEA